MPTPSSPMSRLPSMRHPSSEAAAQGHGHPQRVPRAPSRGGYPIRPEMQGALQDQVRDEALAALAGLRQPLDAAFAPGLVAVQRAIGDWTNIERPPRPYYVALHGHVVLTAQGLGISRSASTAFGIGREERLALCLGILDEPPDVFVTQVHTQLAQLICQVLRDGLHAHLHTSLDVMVLGALAIDAKDKAAFVILCLALGTAVGWAGGAGEARVTAYGLLGLAMGCALVLACGEPLPGTPVAQGVIDGWRNQIKAALVRDEPYASICDDIREMPQASEVPTQDACVLYGRLKEELRRLYLQDLPDAGPLRTNRQIKTAMAQAIAPVRARGRRLLALLRDPQLFAQDEVVQELRHTLGALDARRANTFSHSVVLLRHFQVSAQGLQWRPGEYDLMWHGPGDDSPAMVLARLTLSDAAFVSHVRQHLHAIARSIGTATNTAQHPAIQTSCRSGRPIPEPVGPYASWADAAGMVGILSLTFGCFGGSVALLPALVLGLPLARTACTAGGISSATVCLWAAAECCAGAPRVLDAHALTLAWFRYAQGRADAIYPTEMAV